MAGNSYTSKSVPVAHTAFSGGLNSTSGPLNLQDNESSDLQNIDFNKFGSILKRNGYTALNTTTLGASTVGDGLYWYEYFSSGTLTQKALLVADDKFYKMDGLDGTWDDITGSLTITAGNHCDFDTFLGKAYVTNGVDAPFYWNGSGNGTTLTALQATSYTFVVTGVSVDPEVGDTYTNNTVTYTITGVFLTGGNGTITATGSGDPQTAGNLSRATGSGDATIAFSTFTLNANIQSAKYVKQFSNFLFLSNCTVDGVYYPTRIYYSALKDDTQWSAANYLEISKDDGQEITGILVLSDRLVVYKTRSIYTVFYTGDADIPFILPGGGKTNSPVGCIAPFSLQSVDNGHVFLSQDGLYFFDANNAYKLSYKLDITFQGLNQTKVVSAVSMTQKKKNRYWLAVPNGSSNTNDMIIVWDWYNNAFSIYSGMEASSMYTFYVGRVDERPYFSDYYGFVYRGDVSGTNNDYPLNTKTAIDAYYYTNWKSFDDICDQKQVAHAYLYYQITTAMLTFAYSYDFSSSDTYSSTISTSSSASVYGSGVFGVATYAQEGGNTVRRDLIGRGRVVRFKFSNANEDETFQIDGFGSLPNLETMA